MNALTRTSFVENLVRNHNVTREAAERAGDRTFGKPAEIKPVAPADTSQLRLAAEQNDPALSVQIRARRAGDVLWMEIVTPPRTKKNSAETLGSGKSKPYKRYLADVVEAIAEVRSALRLPLPERRPLGYNLCSHFYVDLRGETADRVGLEQGLYDALEPGGVVTNDWLFRQGDGTRVIIGERPRVALWITPILTVTLDTPEIP
jgi:hypothetical protein